MGGTVVIEGNTALAVPDDGYIFVCWTDGLTAPERHDGKPVDALFAEIANDINVLQQYKGE